MRDSTPVLHIKPYPYPYMYCPGKFGTQAEKEKVAEALWELLTDHGIPVHRFKLPSRKYEGHFESISRHSFCGADCIIMLSIWRECLRLVYTEERCTNDRTAAAVYDASVELWTQYENVWEELNNTDISRTAKAQRVQQAAEEFVRRWQGAVGATSHLYLHLLLVHVPEQILEFGVDLTFLQIQGLEHKHKVRKAFARLMCNMHKKRSSVVVRERKGKALARPYTMDTGPRAVYQMLKYSLLLDSFRIDDYEKDKLVDWDEVRDKFMATAKTDEEKAKAEDDLALMQEARYLGNLVKEERRDREESIKKKSFAKCKLNMEA